MEDDIDIIKAQRDTLKNRLTAQNRWAIRPASIGLFVLGLALFIAWVITSQDTTSLLLLAGIAVASLAVLLYFLSPSAFLRAEVADAEALSGTLNTGRILSGLLIESRGIYLPAALAGATKVFVSLAEGSTDVPKAAGNVFVAPREGAKGIMLDPPGYGLLAHAREIGASFTNDGLENEIKDMLENSMELAKRATIQRSGDEITVSMSGLANAGLCARVRKAEPRICTQIGCPVCSFVACAITEGTGRKLRIKAVDVEGRTVNATFELI